MTKKLFNHKLAAITAAGTVLSMLLVTGAGAEASVTTDPNTSVAVKEPGALTTPPPPQVSPANFGSNNKYLSGGSTSAAAAAGSKVNLDASTNALQIVDKVGFDITLQRWTGSVWVDEGGKTFSKTSDNYISASTSFSVNAGYYYRSKCVHWVYQGQVFEQAITYSDSVLAYK